MKTLILRAQFATAFAAESAKWNVLFPRGKWNLLMPRGTWHGPNFKQLGGSITIDDALLNALVANWRDAGSPALPVRKTHGHLETNDPVALLELQKAYGLLTDFRITADGLEALTEWTPAGAELVKSGEWNFWSPEWAPRFQDRRTGEVKEWWLSGTALTNNPYFHQMPPVAAAVNPTDQPAEQEQSPMNEEQLKQLRASLGLAADASVEVVLKAASQVTADVRTLKATAEKQPTLTAAVQEAVKAAVEPLNAQLKAADAKLLELEVTGLIATAKRGDGKQGRAIVDEKVKPVLLKLIAAESSRDEGLKAASAYLEAIPCTVPMAAKGYGTKEEGALTASVAHEKLNAIANELAAKGTKAPMEQALLLHPELAQAARALTVGNHKES